MTHNYGNISFIGHRWNAKSVGEKKSKKINGAEIQVFYLSYMYFKRYIRIVDIDLGRLTFNFCTLLAHAFIKTWNSLQRGCLTHFQLVVFACLAKYFFGLLVFKW